MAEGSETVIRHLFVERMINDLNSDCLVLAEQASRRAELFRVMHIVCNLIIIISGAAGTIFGASTGNSTILRWATIITSALVTAVKAGSMTVTPEKRGLIAKEAASRLRRISRDLHVLHASKDDNYVLEALDRLYADVDEIDLSLYDTSPRMSTTPERRMRYSSDALGAGQDMRALARVTPSSMKTALGAMGVKPDGELSSSLRTPAALTPQPDTPQPDTPRGKEEHKASSSTKPTFD